MNVTYPGDPIVRAIDEGYCLPYKQVKMGPGWVSESLQDVLKTWDCRIPGLPASVLINAPTGLGKNTFIRNDLAAHAAKQRKYVLLLSNRYTLNLQQKISQSASNDHPPFGTSTIANDKIFGNIIFLLYHEIPYHLYRISQTYDIGFVVLDEAHFFCSDATFCINTGIIFRQILEYLPKAKRIYMSATPGDVKPLIAFEEKQHLLRYRTSPNNGFWSKAITSSCITEYVFPRDYSHIKLHFFDDWKTITDSVNDKESDEKWLIFVSEIETGKQLKKEIANSEFIDATYKNLNTRNIQDLARRKFFKQKALIATTVLYNGFSFEDDLLKNIVLDSADYVEVIQMLGRKRLQPDETIDLYVFEKDETSIRQLLHNYEDMDLVLKEFLYNRIYFNQYRLGNLTPSQQRLFEINENYMVATNPHVPYQLACLTGKYETLSDRFAEEGDEAFVHTVCDWFGVTYAEEDPQIEHEESLYDKTKNAVIEWAEKFVNNRMEKDTFESCVAILMVKIGPVKAKINSAKKNAIRNEQGREVANVTHIFEYFSLPYQCSKLLKEETNGKDIWLITRTGNPVDETDSDITDSEQHT